MFIIQFLMDAQIKKTATSIRLIILWDIHTFSHSFKTFFILMLPLGFYLCKVIFVTFFLINRIDYKLRGQVVRSRSKTECMKLWRNQSKTMFPFVSFLYKNIFVWKFSLSFTCIKITNCKHVFFFVCRLLYTLFVYAFIKT